MRQVTLDDKYSLRAGEALMTGVQAIVRLTLSQRERDRAAGLDTAGYVSGYRGSPLGAVDIEFWRARSHLERNGVIFEPGVNEELAATAVWGTQMLRNTPRANKDGVFALWYGKGPGLDRSGDALKHGNAAGASAHGGVLIIAGDDHAGKSSTVAHQSEFAFIDAHMPVLAPSNVQDVLDLGLLGRDPLVHQPPERLGLHQLLGVVAGHEHDFPAAAVPGHVAIRHGPCRVAVLHRVVG